MKIYKIYSLIWLKVFAPQTDHFSPSFGTIPVFLSNTKLLNNVLSPVVLSGVSLSK